VHINLSKNFENIMNEIPKISAIMIAEFQYNELTKAVNIIEDKKRMD